MGYGPEVCDQSWRDHGTSIAWRCKLPPVFLERSDQSVCTAADGQHHCSGVYQQTGGNGVPSVDQSSKVPVAVGTAEGYYADSPTHTRCIQLGSRHGIQDRQGSLRLETQSCSVCQD